MINGLTYLQSSAFKKQNLKNDAKPKLAVPENIANSVNSFATPTSSHYRAYYLNNINLKHAVGQKVNFGHAIEYHNSWGAQLNKNDNTTSFKLWAPYATRKVVLELCKPEDIIDLNDDEYKNEQLRSDDRDWAGKCHINARVKDGKSTFIEMTNDPHTGEFAANADFLAKNYMYRYHLYDLRDASKPYAVVKDPRAVCQAHIFSWSKVYDNKEYKWQDTDWTSGKDHRKVSTLREIPENELKQAKLSAIAGDGKLFLHPAAIIAEQIHIGTATKEGTIPALKKRIDKVAEDGIFNSILLLPVEGTYGHDWGYDGVDPFAVSRALGDKEGKDDPAKRNDELKELVDYCHQKGLNVGMDWVPSHMMACGPQDEDAAEQGIKLTHASEYSKFSGYVLDNIGPYKKLNEGKWGGIAFDVGQESAPAPQKEVFRKNVRGYLVDRAIHLVQNYHIDFLRTDQPLEIGGKTGSNITMKQIAAEAKHHFPHTVIHWEDHRVDQGLTIPLKPEERSLDNVGKHCEFIDSTNRIVANTPNIGGDEHWDFNFEHHLFSMVRGKEIDGVPYSVTEMAAAMKDIGGTKYVKSHDSKGNHSGESLLVNLIADKTDIYSNLEYRGENEYADSTLQKYPNQIKNAQGEGESWEKAKSKAKNTIVGIQKALRANRAIIDFYNLYMFDKNNWNDNNVEKIKQKYGVKNLNKDKLEDAINVSLTRNKLAFGTMYMAPGSKMVFQGDEKGVITPFYFTRKLAYDEPSEEAIKGYKYQDALEESKLNPDQEVEGIVNFFKDMSSLVNRNNSLQIRQPFEKVNDMAMFTHEGSKVMGVKRFDMKGDEVIAVMNFGYEDYPNYQIKEEKASFPQGQWKETINSNDTKYGGNGKCCNTGRVINVDGNSPINLSIPAGSIVIYERNK